MSASHRFALAIVGSGHIAGIIVRRLIESGYLAADRIIATPSRYLSSHPLPAGVVIAPDNAEAVRDARIVLICVTPQKFAAAAPTINQGLSNTSSPEAEPLFISVMAGLGTARVAEALGGPRVRVIRAMPNLPFGLGRGVTGLYRGAAASDDDLEEARHLFNAGGVCVEVEDEDLMNAVTAVAGSGPAYFYYFVEMMMAGGVAAGLKPQAAQILAAHACVGAGAMLLQADAAPAILRAAVTSPGGTTQAAMDTLTRCDVAQHVTEAVLAAYRRSQELGRLAGGEVK